MSENALWGPIPPELADLTYLEYLDLSDNGLRGEIPPELANLENLEVLNLSNNDFQGEISPELGNLESLETLNLFGNKLEGEIPPELANLENLEVLNLANNRLEGILPDFLADFPNLQNLLLGGNTRLNGCLPERAQVPFCTLPGNLNARLENGDTVLTWDAVEGATHYNLYWNSETFGTNCTVTSGGSTGPSFRGCSALATEITEETYIHDLASSGFEFWVTACTSDGCGTITWVEGESEQDPPAKI